MRGVDHVILRDNNNRVALVTFIINALQEDSNMEEGEGSGGQAETTLRTATEMKVTTKVVTKMETDPLRPGGLPIARTAGAGATGVSTASCDTSSALCSGGGASLVPGCLPNLHIKHQNVGLET